MPPGIRINGACPALGTVHSSPLPAVTVAMGQEYAFGAVIDDRPAITENFAAKQSIDGRFTERPPNPIDVAERVLANPKAADAERTYFDVFSTSGSNLWWFSSSV